MIYTDNIKLIEDVMETTYNLCLLDFSGSDEVDSCFAEVTDTIINYYVKQDELAGMIEELKNIDYVEELNEEEKALYDSVMKRLTDLLA